MSIPANLLYTQDHEWARIEADGTVTIGITDFAQNSLGGIVYVELPAEGDTVSAGQSIGQIESTKSVSELYAPISGEVVETNSELDSQPDLLNAEPYQKGWMVRMQPSNKSELDALLTAAAYETHVAESAEH
jgi:glycine cleavage system H protein